VKVERTVLRRGGARNGSVLSDKSWLELAIAESYGSYGGYGGLSCAKGVQERMGVTGWLNILEGINPRLIAISTLADLGMKPNGLDSDCG